MRKNFYNNIFEEINLTGEIIVISTTKGMYNGKSIDGKKYSKVLTRFL